MLQFTAQLGYGSHPVHRGLTQTQDTFKITYMLYIAKRGHVATLDKLSNQIIK